MSGERTPEDRLRHQAAAAEIAADLDDERAQRDVEAVRAILPDGVPAAVTGGYLALFTGRPSIPECLRICRVLVSIEEWQNMDPALKALAAKQAGLVMGRDAARLVFGGVDRNGAWTHSQTSTTADPGVTLDEVDADPVKPIPVLSWLAWQGAVSILGCRAKAGKTTLLVDRLAAAFDDDRILRGVLVFSEMGARRLKRFCLNRGVPANRMKLIRVCPVESVNRTVQSIRSLNPELVIIDSLTPLVVATTGKAGAMWDPTQARAVLQPLMDAVADTDRACVVAHHAQKDSERLRDSTDLEAGCDMIVLGKLDNASGDTPKLNGLRYSGRWDELDADLIYDPASFSYRTVEVAPKGGKPVEELLTLNGVPVPTSAAWIMKHLGEEWTDREAVMAASGRGKTKTLDGLADLRHAGIVERRGTGRKGHPHQFRIRPQNASAADPPIPPDETDETETPFDPSQAVEKGALMTDHLPPDVPPLPGELMRELQQDAAALAADGIAATDVCGLLNERLAEEAPALCARPWADTDKGPVRVNGDHFEALPDGPGGWMVEADPATGAPRLVYEFPEEAAA